jgi:NAD(P)-dependent dehydrogenase (short-subunit alcohol dehydrogenase family)
MDGICGKTAIVTGGATGIGQASAKRFAREGANVVVADVNEEGGQATVETIERDGGDAVFVRADVSEPADAERIVDAALDAFGSVDLAHNNAGITSGSAVTHEQSVEAWDRTIAVDQRGVWLCMKAEIPQLLDGDGGAIVNTSSLAGLWANDKDAPYSSAKHGVVGLTRTAAVEYADQGLRVNALCPGLTDTPMVPDNDEPLVETTPMGRAADPAELASIAVWLCSDEASFMTGVPVPVDGGAIVGRM